MEAKKSPQADLESKRPIFVRIGLIISLSIMLIAFNWRTYDLKIVKIEKGQATNNHFNFIEITRQDKPLPKVAPVPLSTFINEVKNDQVIVTDVKIDVEASGSMIIPVFIPPAVAPEISIEEKIFHVVEEMPSFPGGETERVRFLSQNLTYPQLAREAGIQGTVYLSFVIERDGSITDVRILRGVEGGCSEEAVRVVNSMLKWNPGNQRGIPVRVQMSIPIKFTLRS